METEMKRFPEMVDKDPWEYVRVALAIETVAYHNKNYLEQFISASYIKRNFILA